MKAIQLLANSKLPEDLRDYSRAWDSKSLGDLMATVAQKYPDQYEKISKDLADIGRNASYRQGETLTLKDFRPVVDRELILGQMDKEIAAARSAFKDPEAFAEERNKIWAKYSDDLERLTQEKALASGNNLAFSVVSGARGKPAQLKAMLTTPGIYADYKDRPIPLFIRHSFAEGLRPAEYLAGTFGARKSVLSTKRATAKGGDWSKQVSQASAGMLVTEKDCGVNNGIDLDVEDSSLRGRVLAQDAAGIPAGTPIDRHVLAKLHKARVEKVIARSALTCQAKNGVCAKCLGLQAGGHFAKIGDAVGITAAQSMGEPLTQLALNSKHTAGQTGGKKEYSGFDVINQISQTPEIFPDRATVAEKDGMVERVEEAPQGGKLVIIGGDEHYVAPGYDILVKPGQKVEAGDQLSDGLVDAGDIVRLRGLGEGRRYYAERLKKAFDDSGMKTDLRNAELVARSVIDHVAIDDPEGLGEFLPDDTASYNSLASHYTLPKDAAQTPVDSAIGSYLQAPALHYSIGTKLTPKMVDRLKQNKFEQVVVAPTAPGFRPEMVRLRTASHNNPDWLARMHTSYLKKNLNDAAARGDDTNIKENPHFAPRLAVGENFGDKVETTGKF